jgi:hypothetical protein
VFVFVLIAGGELNLSVLAPFRYDIGMRDSATRSRLRRALILLGPVTLASSLLRGQSKDIGADISSTDPNPDQKPSAIRLPNGKNQQDEILKADYQKNLKDARELLNLARTFEENLEKDDAFVFSLASVKKLDDMERITKRIRGRMMRL